MKYIVYCTVNNINNKIYVGIHKTFTPNKFDGYLGCGLWTNGTGYKNNTPFQKSVKKYGVENFTRITLSIVPTKFEAMELESVIVTKEFVSRMDTYNVIIGGNIPSILSPVAKYDLGGKLLKVYDTINDAAKEVKVSPTSIYKTCELDNITCQGFYWRLVKENIKDTIVVTKNSTDIIKNGRPVIQYSLAGYKIKEWESAKLAAFKLHCDRATITAACRGKKKTLKNYQWRYASDGIEILPPIKTSGGRTKKILKLDLSGKYIEYYNSIVEASDLCDISTKSLHKSLKSGNSSKGYFWKYV